MTCSAPERTVHILQEEDLQRQAGPWDDLLSRSYDNRIFLTSSWLRIWRESFPAGEARLLALSDGDELQAVLPLLMGGDRILGLLGDWNLFDYMDALAEKGNASSLLQCLWSEALIELPWQQVELRHVPASSPLLRALQVACEQEGLAVAVERDEVCPVALLCSSWEAYLQMLSKKQRHEIRRKLRRVQEDAEWDWRTSRSLAELDRDLESFFDLHEASADDKAGFLTSDVRAFFRAVSAWALRCGWLRLSVLRRNGVDIASTLSFAYRDRWLLYNSGYDPAFSALSPGIAAVALAMQDAIAEKAVAFDFLSGNEPYKYQFGASDTHTCRAVVTR